MLSACRFWKTPGDDGGESARASAPFGAFLRDRADEQVLDVSRRSGYGSLITAP